MGWIDILKFFTISKIFLGVGETLLSKSNKKEEAERNYQSCTGVDCGLEVLDPEISRGVKRHLKILCKFF